MHGWTRVLACAALAAAASSAGAKVSGTTADGVYRFPSGDLPNVPALMGAVQSPAVKAIVVDPGVYVVPSPLFIAARDGLLICGSSGNPKDVVFQSTSSNAVVIQKARHVTFRGVTLSTTAPFDAAVYVDATPSSVAQSYAEDVVFDRCVLSGYEGVLATVGVRDLTITRCKVTVTGSGSPRQGGAGIVWGDGPGLFVGRTKFRAEAGVPAIAGVLVQGAQAANADGGRARGIVITGDDVDGDFAHGFDLADVTDVRVRRNRVSFPSTATSATLPGIAAGSGRVGILVRRANASQLTEDYELFKNRVRGAHYAAWLNNAGRGLVRANDFRACGSPTTDTGFVDHGGAVRMNLLGGRCETSVVANDLRSLRSPTSAAAVIVLPDTAACFVAGAPAEGGNRVDRGRAEFGSNP